MSAVPNELVHFLALSADQQAQVIRRMHAGGWSELGIASATRLSVEQIRRVLTPESRPAASTACPRTGVPASVCTCIGPHEASR